VLTVTDRTSAGRATHRLGLAGGVRVNREFEYVDPTFPLRYDEHGAIRADGAGADAYSTSARLMRMELA
jgi:hypothetical protein